MSDDLDARKAETAYQRVTDTLEKAIDALLREHEEALRRFECIKRLSYDEVNRAAPGPAALAA